MNEQTIIIRACKAYIKELYKLLEFHNSIRPPLFSKDRPSISTTILKEVHQIEDLADELSKDGVSITFREIGKKIPKGVTLVTPETKQRLIEACSAYETILNTQVDFQSKLSSRNYSTPIKKELLIENRMISDIAYSLVNTSDVEISTQSTLKGINKRGRKPNSKSSQSTLKGISKRGRKLGSKNKK